MHQEQPKSNKAAFWKLMRPVTLLLLTVLLFSYVTYAWLNRQWTPSIRQEGITISTSSSLVFLLDNAGESTTSMRIDQVLDLDKDFVLRPVSNATGRSQDFFTLNMSGEEADYHYQHVKPPETSAVADYSQLGIENGYIEFNMALGSTDTTASTQYIYLHHDSHIRFSGNPDAQESIAVNCIRISITITSGSSADQGKTIIFVPDTVSKTNGHTGVNPTNDYMMDGVKFYAAGTNEQTKTHEGKDVVVGAKSTVMHLKDCMADYQLVNNEPVYNPTADNTLFTLTVDPNASSAAPVWITVRIWAEGTDPNCSDFIAGQQIDLMLKFAAIEAKG